MQRWYGDSDAFVESATTVERPSASGNAIVSPAGAPKNFDGTSVCVIVTCPLTTVAVALMSRFFGGGGGGPGGGVGPASTGKTIFAPRTTNPAAKTSHVAWKPST